MEYTVKPGQSLKLPLLLRQNNTPFDASTATDIIATLTVGDQTKQYSLNALAGTGKLILGTAPANNEIIVLIESTDSELWEPGNNIDVEVDVTLPDADFDSGGITTTFCFTPGRTIGC